MTDDGTCTEKAGHFDSVSLKHQQTIKVLVSEFHFRNGAKNLDGSIGTIKITPKQLRDSLAYCIKEV